MTLFIWLIIFIASLLVLIIASNYFTDAAEKIGISLGISPFIVGVTIVAIGTSLPELISSVLAVLRDSSEIVVGNVVGSNVANIFLVLGIGAIIGKKLKITYEIIHVNLSFLVGSAFLLAVTIWDGYFTWSEALLCVACFIIYRFYTTKKHKPPDMVEEGKVKTERRKIDWKVLAILGVSAFSIYLGANYTVESIIKLSEILDLGKEVIAVTAVGFSTSLPELAVTITAAKKKKTEMVIGNVLGSNIFNTLVVMGIPALLGTLIIPSSMLTFNLPVMVIATLLFLFMSMDKEFNNWEGWLLIIFYIFFIGKTFSIF